MSELSNYLNQSDDMYQKTTLLSGQSIGIKPWKVKQEKHLLFALETNDEDQLFVTEQCIALGRKCVDDVGLYDSLSRNTLLGLITNIRKLSKGEIIEINYRCNNEKCSSFQLFDEATQKKTGMTGQSVIPLTGQIDLNEDIHSENFNQEPVKFGNMLIHFKECSYTKQKELEAEYIHAKDEKGKLKKAQLNKFNYELILASVNKVEFTKSGEESKVFKDFDEGELESLLDNLLSTEYDVLIKEFTERVSEFKLEKKVKCPSCNNETTISYDNIFSLLVF